MAYSHAREPLYVAFVDFRKAFSDSVPRARLWAKLRARGVGPFMMRALEATYVDVPLSVRTRAGVSLPFFSTCGLKQGDPNSPNLFGLYVDDLVILIEELGDAAALPTLGGRRIPPLLHADDLALVATTRAGLQAQLDALDAYSARWSLTVDLSKTKVMNLGGGDVRARLVRATYNGAPRAQVPAFNYLGITFKEGEPLGASAPAARLRPADKALGVMRGSCARAGPLPPAMQAEVWDALVRPVLLHGVELWGAYPPAIGAPGDGRRRVESSHTSFLRGLLATRAATPELVVMAETGRFPLALFIARQVYATWRRLNALDDDDRWVVRAVLRDSEALAAEGGSPWAGAVREMLATLELTGAETPVELEERLRREYAARLSAADGPKIAFYRDAVRGWSGGIDIKTWSALPEYLRVALPAGRRDALARLRCASHFLRVETGRWTPAARPPRGGAAAPRRVQPARSASAASRAASSQERVSPSPPAGRGPARVRLEHAQRVCRLCASGEVEDETHVIFRCSFPAIVSLRTFYSTTLFPSFPQPLEAGALRRFLEQPPALVCSAFSLGAYDKILLD